MSTIARNAFNPSQRAARVAICRRITLNVTRIQSKKHIDAIDRTYLREHCAESRELKCVGKNVLRRVQRGYVEAQQTQIDENVKIFP